MTTDPIYRSDAVTYWRGFLRTAEQEAVNTVMVLAVDLRRLIDALDAAQAEAASLRAEVQRLNQLARQHRRS